MSTLLRGATVVDGTGAPGRRADVLVEGDRIRAVEPRLTAPGAEVIDLDGLVLAPGFIDIHTHYDAQVLWDPDLTPSSWHGVTTVVMGNCGFSLAPTKAADRPAVVGTLELVEDMSADALDAGIRWEFESFPDYLALLERLPKRLNVGAMVGHSAVRLYALGDEAFERAAEPDEVAAMGRALADGLDAGALGFATSRSPSHVGQGGRPVPSRVGATDELLRLVDVVTASRHGVVQIAAGMGLDEVALIAARTDRNITWTALLTGRYEPISALEMVERTAGIGPHVWSQISCRPLVMQMNLLEPRGLATMPSFAAVLAVPVDGREALYREPGLARRRRARPRRPLGRPLGPRHRGRVGPAGPGRAPDRRHRRGTGRRTGRRAARRRPRRPPAHPLRHAGDERRRSRARGAPRATTARSSACPTPGRTAASSATPATRPTCSATGSGTGRRCRSSRRCGG